MARTTKQDRDNARAMHNQGVGIQRISDFYGVRPDTVRGWISDDFASAQSRKYAKRAAIRKHSNVPA